MRKTLMLTAGLFGVAFAGAAQAQNLSVPAGDAAFSRETAARPSVNQSWDYQALVTVRPVHVAPGHHRGAR